MALNSTLNASLANDSLRVFFAIQVDFPTYTLRLIESDGEVRFDVDGVTATFTGKDSIYGTISGIGSITEAIATSAPEWQLSLLAPTESAVGELCQPSFRGSLTRVWFGNLSETTGLPIGIPELIFIGQYDIGVISESADTRVVDCSIKSVWERLFAAQEGQRLNDVWHQAIHPGDLCLSLNTQVAISQPWGMNSPVPQPGAVPSSGGGGSGSGTGGGSYVGGGIIGGRYGGGDLDYLTHLV